MLVKGATYHLCGKHYCCLYDAFTMLLERNHHKTHRLFIGRIQQLPQIKYIRIYEQARFTAKLPCCSTDNNCRADSRPVPSPWETSLQSNAVFHWLGANLEIALNKMNPGYFPLAATALKPQQIPMFLHISARVWGHRWSPHTSEQKGSMLKPQ